MEDSKSGDLDPARSRTDTGLLSERDRSDAEHARASHAAQGETDERIRIYRARNSALLSALRKLSDAGPGREPSEPERARVAQERSRSDRKTDEAKRAVDEALEQERAEHERSLAKLVAAERAETDRLLELERMRADELIDARDEFLGMVAHDLRNLLASISSFAELIKHTAPGQAAEAALRIRTNATEMAVLINDLLDVSAIAAGALRTERCEDDVIVVVQEVVESFQPVAADRGVALAAQAPAGLPPIQLDRARIFQVLANLVTNSIRHTGAGGSIRVEVEPAGRGVRLSVRDTGCGIPSGLLEGIFDRFRQGTSSGHSGLGLYIARGIVSAHGGEIRAESDGATGTTVSFTLPGSAA